jgi:23S rRNA pseudouridine1911/1915/1917 synthase
VQGWNWAGQFEERKVEKKYQAVVIGEIAAEGEFRSEIDGKQAFTRFRRVQVSPSLRFGHLSLVDLFPETGRTHQLRIHLSEDGLILFWGISCMERKG